MLKSRNLFRKVIALKRKLIKFLLIIFVFVILVFVALAFFTAGDRKIAKEFVISCCGSKLNEFVWYDLLHDGLKKRWTKINLLECLPRARAIKQFLFPQFLKAVLPHLLKVPPKQKLAVRRKYLLKFWKVK